MSWYDKQDIRIKQRDIQETKIPSLYIDIQEQERENGQQLVRQQLYKCSNDKYNINTRKLFIGRKQQE